MNQPVSFEIAKLLKEKGYDLECEDFYSKYGSLNYLKPHGEYEHLHSYSRSLESYFDGKYNWNCLEVDEGMIALQTAFSEADEYVNCECSAPTIAEVVMWLYEKHGIWIRVTPFPYSDNITHWRWEHMPTKYAIRNAGWKKEEDYKSPTEAYERAIEYVLTRLI